MWALSSARSQRTPVGECSDADYLIMVADGFGHRFMRLQLHGVSGIPGRPIDCVALMSWGCSSLRVVVDAA